MVRCIWINHLEKGTLIYFCRPPKPLNKRKCSRVLNKSKLGLVLNRFNIYFKANTRGLERARDDQSKYALNTEIDILNESDCRD